MAYWQWEVIESIAALKNKREKKKQKTEEETNPSEEEKISSLMMHNFSFFKNKLW